ncbi:transaldolase [Pseudonocardia dioxanivorans CB1190]|uniref:Transaldolase n=1 Tax=Pseudonocardia dioxanivorans (strain ATCC 55486 / DSM 44775 / JCM 13855 / CB1190) TaxID=675635 RepID=F4CNB9_PSEUX|nr:transaldolase [Pseudonocardia dioxanivorans]AEA27143.1 transaldolase [Pseudonocardia dioxanivorans CB1190]
MADDRLAGLTEAGVSIWLDDLTRAHLVDGHLRRLVDDSHIVGVTTNPTILAASLARPEPYAPEIRELARAGVTVGDAVRQLVVADVQQACDLFREVWEATAGVDGRVSLEVDPALAGNREATVVDAVSLVRAVGRPNLSVKIPATRAGLPAITDALALGVDVNVTLIFSVARYRAVMAAYLAGLERALDHGTSLSGIHSVASFFVSRVDVEVDERLDKIGSDDALALRGMAGVANSRLAYQAFRETFTGPRWERLQAAGARVQRPLWASTGVKNPAYPDTMYVSELALPGTVNTMPEATLRAFADHGVVRGPDDRQSAAGDAAQAQEVIDAVAAAGVDLAEVLTFLERDGVDRFAHSWAELHDTVGRALAEATRQRFTRPPTPTASTTRTTRDSEELST